MTEKGELSIGQPEKAEKKNFAERFFERWNVELKRVGDSVNEADREARLKLQTLNADVLRRAGFRQTAYGIALTSLHTAAAGFGAGVGGFVGAVGGGAAGVGIGALSGALATSELGPGMIGGAIAGGWVGLGTGAWAGMIGGSLLGYQAGVELSGVVYNKFIRKIDPEQLPLSKFDWIIGQVPGLNPPIVGGLRNMFEGFFGLAAKREESQLSAVSAQLSAVK